MAELFNTVSEVITNILTLFGSVASTLLNNEIFQIMFGIIILGILFGLIFDLTAKIVTMGPGKHKIFRKYLEWRYIPKRYR